MVAIRVDVTIEAGVELVWHRLQDIGSHVEWMHDAEAIRFEGEQRTGVGTAFACDTRVGPLRTVDMMTVTRWEPPLVMGVAHTGAVSGTGTFTLLALPGDASRLTWEEELAFPWWLGGRLGEAIGAPVLRWVWRRNLSNLEGLVERG